MKSKQKKRKRHESDPQNHGGVIRNHCHRGDPQLLL
jgi:hypothetical protein